MCYCYSTSAVYNNASQRTPITPYDIPNPPGTTSTRRTTGIYYPTILKRCKLTRYRQLSSDQRRLSTQPFIPPSSIRRPQQMSTKRPHPQRPCHTPNQPCATNAGTSQNNKPQPAINRASRDLPTLHRLCRKLQPRRPMALRAQHQTRLVQAPAAPGTPSAPAAFPTHVAQLREKIRKKIRFFFPNPVAPPRKEGVG